MCVIWQLLVILNAYINIWDKSMHFFFPFKRWRFLFFKFILYLFSKIMASISFPAWNYRKSNCNLCYQLPRLIFHYIEKANW